MLLDNFSPADQATARQTSDDRVSKRLLKAEQMDEIFDLIIQGKYSSACLRLLELTGKNPLHYIPYRTYNRLQKQRQQAAIAENVVENATVTSGRSLLPDLDYVEAISDKVPPIQGGLARSFKDVLLAKTSAVFWAEPARCH